MLIDYIALLCWCIGFLFEAVGDYQLTKFKKNPANKGAILKTGLWRYTRHPNYFGDATVWLSFGLFSIASGGYWQISWRLRNDLFDCQYFRGCYARKIVEKNKTRI